MVCLGNICRSPTAEVVLRTIAMQEAPDLFSQIDSAGTADYHTGDPPDPRSIEAGLRRGYDLRPLRARQLRPEDFNRFDLLLAMDEGNLAVMRRLAPVAAQQRARLLLEFAADAGTTAVPDPYYGSRSDFERVIELCELGARGLISSLRAPTDAGARSKLTSR